MKSTIDKLQPVVFNVGYLGEHYWSWVEKPDTGHPRFFSHWLLESCSKTPWWVVPCLWVPVFLFATVKSMLYHQVSFAQLMPLLVIGVLAWQLMEYLIHRFVFHARSTSYWGITFHFLFHGCHHKYPMDKLRLVFPPVPASTLVAAVYFTLHAAFAPNIALPIFAGMGFGYVAYDCLHYAVHYHGSSLPTPLLQDLRSRHIQHHYKDSSKGFGISSVLFDIVFQTGS